MPEVTNLSEQSISAFSGRRIAIFEPHPDFATNPSLRCLSEALIRSGAKVDIFMPDEILFPPVNRDLTSVYPFPRAFALWRGGVKATLHGWWENLQQFQTDRMFKAGAYDLIIVIDSAGVIKGYEYAKRFKVPMVYISFEIFFRDELSAATEIAEKEHECIASRFAELVIIQDQQRAELLAAENNLSLDKFAYLPVSPQGSQTVLRSEYLRKYFNLGNDKTIVLHSGSFADWTYADELLESVGTWPEDFVLVIHTRYNPGNTNKYVKAIKEAKLPNVFLSTEPLPANAYEQLIASADIGLVLYKPIPPSRYLQKNIQTIGLASGKFSFYMKYGLPVISIAQQSYADLLKDYLFGENLDSISEMAEALRRVKSNYTRHKTEAQRLFSERLDFDLHWPRLSAKLLEILR